ncbi:neuronal-specific septin-3-like [Limulus polyphemus]|uniref:Neuronal-specific septin-3-like n=1 Tax=Limulus polyphemus TaxID=6850 RepID=A0ABM1BM25_LIMPO|nr:neuronal-specific septin-3-like [Limulus polyphemus]
MEAEVNNRVFFPTHLEEALRETFLEADTQGRGYVESKNIVNVVRKVLGIFLTHTEKAKVIAKAEYLATKGLLSVEDFFTIMADTLVETTHWGNLKTEIAGYVGIDTLQEQIRKKVLKRGFEFNIMVVGRSGLGKSTLINTLFKANVSLRSCSKSEEKVEIAKTTHVKSVSHVIEEKGVRLRLTVTDTPGFGDQINNDKCWLPVLDYINEQYENYLSEEQSVSRKKHIPDTRIHCCLYFIAPTGHSLSPLDIEFMRRLDRCVNIVPVIAKADTLTVEERTDFKQREMLPFAVVGSNQQYPVNGRTVYGRRTQWGLVEVENKGHCEFSDLRDMLIRTHMQDLVEVTRSVHYENFRHERLASRRGRTQINGQVIDMDSMNESSL